MTTTQASIRVVRRPEKFDADDSRVITRFFPMGGEDRVRRVIGRVLALSPDAAQHELDRVLHDFGPRHRDLAAVLDRHFGHVREHVRAHQVDPDALDPARRRLIGAYFTMEYAIASAALFNPSVAPHPDQRGLGPGEVRFIMSLRATGEGHVSSIVFRCGVLDAHGHIRFAPASPFAAQVRVREDRTYDKKLFFLKLIEMAAYSDAARTVLDELPPRFTLAQLDHKLAELRQRPDRPSPISETADNMLWLARSNYQLTAPPDTDPSEIVIFPTTENESHGLEDARLTRFVDDDGSVTWFGTYTAYNGFRILPQLLETTDFRDFAIHTLNGRYVQNKGMALFPRRIGGAYCMISRLDGENMFIMRSDNPHFWNQCEKLQAPRYPWEFVQIGNCGAPLETDAGWLLLTHGVGAMRRYCIGAILLDRDNPSRVIGHLPEPLLSPAEDERDGYVPNVVYSCGAMIHGDVMLLPYAMSDSASSFATLSVSEILAAMAPC